MIRQTVKLVSCALLAVSAEALAQQEAEREVAEASAWTLTVVKLGYADAEEVAYLLSQVLPPSVRVVAYRPTNSLIIAGDSAIVGKLAKPPASREVPAPESSDAQPGR